MVEQADDGSQALDGLFDHEAPVDLVSRRHRHDQRVAGDADQVILDHRGEARLPMGTPKSS